MNLTVLYAEDDERTRKEIGEILCLKIQKVLTAKDGAEALELFKKNSVDFVISDYRMPKRSGNELCRAIKEIQPQVPFVLLTAFNDTELLTGAIDVGVDKFLQKPLEINQFTNLLKDVENKIALRLSLEKSCEKEKSKLIKKANSDPMRGISNKMFLLQRLETLLQYSQREEDIISVIFFDIDNFKHINGEYGHMYADRLLVKLTELVKKHIRKDDLFGRWGGDEFVIVVKEHSKEAVLKFVDKLYRVINGHNWSDDMGITVTLGVAFNDGKIDAKELVSQADFKMLEAKKMGKNRWQD
ncbi:diguanylate cyclase [Sulfurimonas sp.]|uniref:diguanylate cyclase n=1 Tax=Sulfurimonas sp. TaxID=2022749 RepID=UPI0026042E1B|nr:diguanylate cyclase [Sulfurimonas sp.]